MSVTTDESTGMLRVKTLRVVHLQIGVAKSFYFDLEHVKCSINAKILFNNDLSNS